MKAAVYLGPNRVKIQEMPNPQPKQDEVLIRFKAGSICGTDLHFYRGDWTDLDVGKIIGHDVCGQIEETGEFVGIIPKLFCGSCRYCMQGQPHLCEHSEGFMGLDRDGLFSELIAVPRHNLVPIPPNVSVEEAGILEPVSLALHTFDLLSPKLGEWVTILGQGPIGLLMTQVARVCGCRVIAVDPEGYRLELSRKYGADACINPKDENVPQRVREIVNERSDIVIEAAGHQDTVEQSSSIVKKAGRVALVGAFSGSMNLGEAEEAKFFSVITNPIKYSLALDLLSRKILDVKGLITHKFPLTSFEKAIKTAATPSKKPVKVVISSDALP